MLKNTKEIIKDVVACRKFIVPLIRILFAVTCETIMIALSALNEKLKPSYPYLMFIVPVVFVIFSLIHLARQ